MDEDLNQIYERISPKIGISKEKIFRVSSHKIMLYAAAAYDITMFIPEYMRKTDIRRIFRNAEIPMPEHSGVITPIWSDLTKGRIDGDWDGYLSFLRTYNVCYVEGLYSVLDYNYELWKKKCYDIYNGTNKNYTTFYGKKMKRNYMREFSKFIINTKN